MNERRKPAASGGKQPKASTTRTTSVPTRTRSSAAKPQKQPSRSLGKQVAAQFARLDAWLTRASGVLSGRALGQTARRWLFASRCVLSLVSVLYLVGVVVLAYRSVFFRLEIPTEQRGIYCLLTSLACLGILLVMLYTRKQFLTRISIMLAMPFYLFIFLFNYQHLVLLVPLGLLIVISYFASGVREGPKTILGSVYLMIYILGTFGYLIAGDLLKPASTRTITESGVSATGSYRYAVTEVQDKADGSTFIAIEPNTYDIIGKHHRWIAKGYDKTIYLVRPLTRFTAEWTTETRAAITADLLAVNPDVTFTLTADQLKTIGKDIGYTESHTISSLSRAQRAALGIAVEKDLIGSQTAESLGLTLRDGTDTLTLSYDQLLELDMTIACDTKLSTLTDANLAALGVPEVNDVLSINGKLVFRQYVAVLEETFASSKRSYDVLFDF